MNRRFPVRVFVACAIAFSVAFSVALSVALLVALPAKTAPLTTVRVGTKSNDDVTSLIYAQKSGMFTAAGLNVQISKLAGSGQTISDAVLAETFDIGKSGTLPLIQAHLKNIPLIFIAPGGVHRMDGAPYGGLCVSKDSPIRDDGDLKMLTTETIGLSTLADVGQLAIMKALDDAGRDAKGLHFVEIPQDVAPAAVEAGRVAGAECEYPVLTEALASNKIRLVPFYYVFGSDWAATAWFTSKDYASKNPDAVETFARVLAAAARYANAHPDVTAPMLAEFSGVSLDMIKRTPRVALGTQMLPSLLQTIIDAAAKYGMIPHRYPAAEIIDPDVLTK